MESQRPAIEIEQHLREMNDEWLKALVRRDGDTFQRIMADDFVFIYPVEGDDKAQFISDITSGHPTIEHTTRHHLTVPVLSSPAVLRFGYTPAGNHTSLRTPCY